MRRATIAALMIAAGILGACGLSLPAKQLASGEIDGIHWTYSVSIRDNRICDTIVLDDGTQAGGRCGGGGGGGPFGISGDIWPRCSMGGGLPTFAYGRVRSGVDRVQVSTNNGSYDANSLLPPDDRYQSSFFVIAMRAGVVCQQFLGLATDGSILSVVAPDSPEIRPSPTFDASPGT